MKKRKMNLKKLALQKQTVASMETVQGGIKETQFIVICATLINTIIVTTTTVVTGTKWPPIDPPPIISKDYVSCITQCMC